MLDLEVVEEALEVVVGVEPSAHHVENKMTFFAYVEKSNVNQMAIISWNQMFNTFLHFHEKIIYKSGNKKRRDPI